MRIAILKTQAKSKILTSPKEKGFNMGLKVQKSKISSPKLSPKEITSPNPDIKSNSGFYSYPSLFCYQTLKGGNQENERDTS
ncbi:hypothetical protein GF396_04440 [Candidatus Pacearchaeota archaeon]|nr:hypothetical protein [Candidatus Pacearchaeota archaeon]